MEYIDGQSLDYEKFGRLSRSRQMNLVNQLTSGATENWPDFWIRSLRQGNRVLDLSDVTQHDWHRGQILLHTRAITNIDHVVLIDFGSATQTWEIEIINNASNFFGAMSIFLNDAEKFGLGEWLILDCFGEPDD